jgi:tRNA (guanine-N7-)-methyltransferase
MSSFSSATTTQLSFPPAWTESELELLGSLSKEQQFVIQQHVQRYTDQVREHVLRKTVESKKDSDKLWKHATKKIRAAMVKTISAAVPVESSIGSVKVSNTEEKNKEKVDYPDSTTTTSTTKTTATSLSKTFYNPYSCLGLELPSDTVRAKQAVERVLPTVGDWSIFSNPTLPLVVDVGCGTGQWTLRAAYEEKMYLEMGQRRNYLGLEIREGLVRTASSFAEQLQLDGIVGFWHGTVNEEYWDKYIKNYPGQIILFCCQLPDPRLKKNVRRKNSRGLLTTKRILQPELAAAVVSSMPDGGVVYISSDYEEVAIEMKTTLEEHSHLQRMTNDYSKLLILLKHPYKDNKVKEGENGWLLANPFRLPTEREHFLHMKGSRKVYRVAFVSFTFLFCILFFPSEIQSSAVFVQNTTAQIPL